MPATNDTFDDFTARPLDPHQCYHYVSRDVRCTNQTVQNDYFCPEHRMAPAPIIRFPHDGFWLPELTGRDSVLRALSKISERLAQNALDPKRAGRLLYACQVANSILDGKLREQQLALKRDQLDQKRQAAGRKPATTARVPHSCSALSSTGGLEPSPTSEPTPSPVTLSEAQSAQSKDPGAPQPATTAKPIQPQMPQTAIPTNNEEHTTNKQQLHNGPQNAPQEGEGVPLLQENTDPLTGTLPLLQAAAETAHLEVPTSAQRRRWR
jgi:hypothetical protein